MIGISLYRAIALGLHLRDKDPAADEFKKDVLTYKWWVAYSIECLRDTTTGLPLSISGEYCTVPLPDSLPNKHHSSRDTSRDVTRVLTGPSSVQFPSDSNRPELDKDNSTTKPYLTSRIEISLLSREAQ